MLKFIFFFAKINKKNAYSFLDLSEKEAYHRMDREFS